MVLVCWAICLPNFYSAYIIIGYTMVNKTRGMTTYLHKALQSSGGARPLLKLTIDNVK